MYACVQIYKTDRAYIFFYFFSFFNAEWCPNSNRNLVIEIVYVSFPFRFSLFFSNVRRITTLYIKTKHYVFSCYFPQASFFFLRLVRKKWKLKNFRPGCTCGVKSHVFYYYFCFLFSFERKWRKHSQCLWFIDD